MHDTLRDWRGDLKDEDAHKQREAGAVDSLKAKVDAQTRALDEMRLQNQHMFEKLDILISQTEESMEERPPKSNGTVTHLPSREADTHLEQADEEQSLLSHKSKRNTRLEKQRQAIERVLQSNQQAGISMHETIREMEVSRTSMQMSALVKHLDQRLNLVGRATTARMMLRDVSRFGSDVWKAVVGGVNKLRRGWDNLEYNVTWLTRSVSTMIYGE